MKVVDLRKMSSNDLKSEKKKLLREQYNLRMQNKTGQLSKTSQLKSVNRNIARVNTILTELEE